MLCDQVLRIEFRVSSEERLECFANAARPIGGYLIAHREMHGHVQKRIGLAHLRGKVLPNGVFAIVEQRSVFRMFKNHIENLRFDRLKRHALLMLLPRIQVDGA